DDLHAIAVEIRARARVDLRPKRGAISHEVVQLEVAERIGAGRNAGLSGDRERRSDVLVKDFRLDPTPAAMLRVPLQPNGPLRPLERVIRVSESVIGDRAWENSPEVAAAVGEDEVVAADVRGREVPPRQEAELRPIVAAGAREGDVVLQPA